MAHKCGWCWMTMPVLEAQGEESNRRAEECDASGDLGAAQSHADDAATIRACIAAREEAESVPGVLGSATLHDLAEEIRGVGVKKPTEKATTLLGALLCKSLVWRR
jgi:hypothetical protein